MAQDISTSITRRSMVAGLALSASPIALAGADKAYAQAKQTTPEKSLYERLGGVFAIAAVVDHFSDAVVKNPIVGQKSKNPQLREWHTKNLGRLPGLKFMRTLWVCDVSGGPFQFTATKPGATPLGLEEAHRDLRISPAEFDEVAAELGRTLDFFKVPKREKTEVLAAFAAHKGEVTAGYVEEVEALEIGLVVHDRHVDALRCLPRQLLDGVAGLGRDGGRPLVGGSRRLDRPEIEVGEIGDAHDATCP